MNPFPAIINTQDTMKKFRKHNMWFDEPCVSKFEYLHAELVGMLRQLRYKSGEECIQYASVDKGVLQDGIDGAHRKLRKGTHNMTIIYTEVLNLQKIYV